MNIGIVRLAVGSVLVIAGVTLVAPAAHAQVAVSTAVTNVALKPKLSDFDQAASAYFRASERDIAAARDRKITEDDLPVALFIAQRADQDPVSVVNLRLRGYSWPDIAARFHLGADAFYFAADGASGPVYGRAFGYYNSRPRSQWNTIVLGDADIVNLVQLRFLSEHYRVSPSVVMDLRERSGDFVAVQREIASRTAAGRSGGF